MEFHGERKKKGRRILVREFCEEVAEVVVMCRRKFSSNAVVRSEKPADRFSLSRALSSSHLRPLHPRGGVLPEPHSSGWPDR